MVNRTLLSSRRTQATFPNDDKDAVSSVNHVNGRNDPGDGLHTAECLNISY